jgi:hypothetical protein
MFALSKHDATQRVGVLLGAGNVSFETLVELVRCEVHSRSHVLRSVTIERVVKLLGPTVSVSKDEVDEACDALEREGDLVNAPGGVLYSTPLRAVFVNRSVRVFGSLPTRALASGLDRGVSAQGASRSVPFADDLLDAIRSLGGAVVPAATWAGLEHAPKADMALLAYFDQRLAWEPRQTGSLERYGALEWRSWQRAKAGFGWRSSTDGRLWWARSRFGVHHHAWTLDASPRTSSFIDLNRDEADRARFALMADAHAPFALKVERSSDHALVEVPSWLPRAEYRWISLHAEAVVLKGRTLWRIELDQESALIELLVDQLGLTVETP